MYNTIFAKQFKATMVRRGITQKVMAQRLNTTEATISRYVSGERIPNVEIAAEMARILNVTVDELIGASQPSRSNESVEIDILFDCYKSATADDKDVLWTLLSRYMTTEQKIVISAVRDRDRDKKVETEA